MRKYLSIAFLMVVSAAANAEKVLVDVPGMVGKDKSEVAKIIGNALSCNSTKYGEKCTYEMADTEIVFIDNRADRITIEGMDSSPFSDTTIELLGFDSRSPSFKNTFTKLWESIEGLLSVSHFKGTNNSDYAYIKAYTE